MTLEENNIRISRQFIRQADRELQNGDSLQASEKAWGSVVHHLKAIARQRRWRHGGHYNLSEIIDRLAAETNQPEMKSLFSVAESLHANFYNNWKTEDMVRSNIQDVKNLLERLDGANNRRN